MKYAVSHVGRQSDGVWVLGSAMYVGSDGTEVPVEDSQHVWVCHIYCGPGVAAEADQCYKSYPAN